MRRQLTGLSFNEAIAHIVGAQQEEPNGYYQLTRPKPHGQFDVFPASTIGIAAWSVEEILATDWVFEDHTPVPDCTDSPDPSGESLGRLFTRDDILTAVSAEVGLCRYKNPESHSIAINVVKRLGFPE